jgi:hypothetical protein
VGSARARLEVTGTEIVGGAPAWTFTTTQLGSLASPSVSSALAEGPSGVTLVRSGDPSDPLVAELVPYQLFYYPLEAGTSFVQLACRGVDAGEDLDGDARNEGVDVRSVVTVVGTEDVTVPVGAFRATRIDTDLTLAFHLTTGGVVQSVADESEWYAPGVGLVRATSSLSVLGIAITDRTELVAYDVGGVAAGFPPVTAIASGQLVVGEVAQGGLEGYAAAVAPGTTHAATLLGASDLVTLSVYGDDATLAAPVCATGASREARECRLPPTSSPLYLGVDGALVAGPSAGFALLVAPPPAVATPADEVATIPADTVAVGQVGPLGESHYTAIGLAPGVPATVAIAALTADADLRVYVDATRSLQLACTLGHSDVSAEPESCTFVPGTDTAGTDVYFDVWGGELERDGAAYRLVVVEGP